MRKITLRFTVGIMAAMITASVVSGGFLQKHRTQASVLAAVQTVKARNEFSFGSGNFKNILKEGTYEVSVKMQNASKTDLNDPDLFNVSYTSMAGSCIKGAAKVKIAADGTATVTIPLQKISVFGTTAWGRDWKIYKSVDSEETVDAEIVEGTKEQPAKIRFALPDSSKNGVCVSVSSNGHPSKAILAMNWKEAKEVKVSAPASIKATALDYQKVKVSWSKVDGATGYEVYQNNKKVADVTATSYTKSGLKTGSTYTYKVRAYKTVDRAKVYSIFTKDAKAKLVLGKVTGVKVSNNKKLTATVTWKKVSGANGYSVYRATSAKGKYTKVQSVKGNTVVKYADKKVKKNKKYFYKVRAYRIVSGKIVYGTYSSRVNVKIKK